MPFGCVTNTQGFVPYHFSTFVPFPANPTTAATACYPMPPAARMCNPFHQYQKYDKENFSTMCWLKELQMTRSEIYQALMIYVLRSADKERYGYPTEDINAPGRTVISNRPVAEATATEGLKNCCRCNTAFSYRTMDGGSKCVFHWGKLRRAAFGSKEHAYTCCRQPKGSAGCRTTCFHVSADIGDKTGPRFVKTASTNRAQCIDVFALDCEMCYTSQGLELTKVSLVAIDGTIVYDSYVKPDNLILDYNTQFSGVRFEDLVFCTNTLADVQKDLLAAINSRTILVGHGLENDLKALRIVHSMVIDTSVVFPHHLGFPYRRSLKHLVSSVLKKNIQREERSGLGHNSVEDARSCVELMLWKLKQDKEQNNKNLFTYNPFDCSAR